MAESPSGCCPTFNEPASSSPEGLRLLRTDSIGTNADRFATLRVLPVANPPMARLTPNRFIGLASALVFSACAQTAIAAEASPFPPSTALFGLTLSRTVDGQALALASLHGRPLLINFWARWCQPCRKEIPDLAALHARHRSSGLEVVGIAVEEAEHRESVRDFAKAYEMTFVSLIGGLQPSIDLMRALGNSKAGLPFTVVIDRTGTIRSSKLGAMTSTEMEAALRLIL